MESPLRSSRHPASAFSRRTALQSPDLAGVGREQGGRSGPAPGGSGWMMWSVGCGKTARALLYFSRVALLSSRADQELLVLLLLLFSGATKSARKLQPFPACGRNQARVLTPRSQAKATQIKTYSWDNAQVILVGNKCDLEDNRVIPTEDGKRLADELGLEFFEASAKDNINVKQVFERLVDIICEKMNESLDANSGMNSNNHKNTALKESSASQSNSCSC
ncbi:ras-related protein Rab-3D isoform X3 [Erythrolamprus reginae]|uniref:ras-related protein Rab-3D isoform X3 n=1 Tax=Erythrolamprus reginae TaxID=121349 RepID=UPI00396CE0A1